MEYNPGDEGIVVPFAASDPASCTSPIRAGPDSSSDADAHPPPRHSQSPLANTPLVPAAIPTYAAFTSCHGRLRQAFLLRVRHCPRRQPRE